MPRKLLMQDQAVGRTVEDVRLYASDTVTKAFILFDDNTALVLKPIASPGQIISIGAKIDWGALSLDEQVQGGLKSMEVAQEEAEQAREAARALKEKQERAELDRLKAKYE